MSDRPSATSTVKIDNAQIRVTEWRFVPGAATGWHRHALDYVVVPLTTGTLHMVDGAGETHQASLVTGEPYAREAGVEHDVVNPGDTDFAFLEIEIK